MICDDLVDSAWKATIKTQTAENQKQILNSRTEREQTEKHFPPVSAERSDGVLNSASGRELWGDWVIPTVSIASLGWKNGVNSDNRCLGIFESDSRSNMRSSTQKLL